MGAKVTALGDGAGMPYLPGFTGVRRATGGGDQWERAQRSRGGAHGGREKSVCGGTSERRACLRKRTMDQQATHMHEDRSVAAPTYGRKQKRRGKQKRGSGTARLISPNRNMAEASPCRPFWVSLYSSTPPSFQSGPPLQLARPPRPASYPRRAQTRARPRRLPRRRRSAQLAQPDPNHTAPAARAAIPSRWQASTSPPPYYTPALLPALLGALRVASQRGTRKSPRAPLLFS